MIASGQWAEWSPFELIEAAISRGDTRIEQLMDTGEIIAAAKSGHPAHVSTMVGYILAEECSEKYAFLAQELLGGEIGAILDKFFAETELMRRLFSAMRRERLEETPAGYFASVVSSLLNWKPEPLLQYLFVDNDYSEAFIRHIEHRSIAELISLLIKCEYGGSQFAIEKMHLLELVVCSMCDFSSVSALKNAKLVLTAAIETATDLKGWKIYMALLLQSPCIRLLAESLVSPSADLVCTAADIITSLLTLEEFDDVYDYPFADVRRAPSPRRPPALSPDQVFDVFDLLDSKILPITTALLSIGSTLAQPSGIGSLGVSLVRLLTALVENSIPKLERSIASHRVFSTVFSLFTRYPWATFFHLSVQRLVEAVLGSCSSGLKYDLIVTTELPLVLYLIAKQPSCEVGGGKNARKGNLGLVTRIGNELLQAANTQPFVDGCLERIDAWKLLTHEILECRAAIEKRKLGEEDPPTAPETPSNTAFSQGMAEQEGEIQKGSGEVEEFYEGWYWKLPVTGCEALIDLDGDFVKERSGAIRDTYRIGGKLGDGAFGSVRKITHRVTGEVRAVKTIHKKSLRTPEEQATFFNEVAVLRALDHPNILKLYEFYQDEKNYYLITEFCAGGELYDRIINAGFFSEAVAAGIMRQILSCVMYCHSKGVVHRDLKPENFLFESSTPNASIKVIDFGTAQFFTPEQVLTSKFGTPYYIAPEVLRKHYTEKCDVWSAGVNMYILLCGFPPFGGNTDDQILKKVSAGRFNFPSPEWDPISAEAKDLITQMLILDPDRRISAREALNHRWLQHASSEQLNPTSASVIFKNLQTFKTEQTLQKATLTFIASQLSTNAEKADMLTIFQSLDSDNSGTLSRAELIKGFEQLFGSQIEDIEGEVDRIMTQVDSDRSGEIDYTEFAIATMNRQKMVSREHLEAAFRAFDLDGNGTISKDELRTMLGGNKHYSDEVWEGIVREVDQNGDGLIDFREFMDMMMRYNH